MAGGRDVQVVVAQHCEVVVRGRDECDVLDQLAAWVRGHRDDLLIIGLQWSTTWVLDVDGVAQGDQTPDYTVTMQFRIGPQQLPGWGDDRSREL